MKLLTTLILLSLLSVSLGEFCNENSLITLTEFKAQKSQFICSQKSFFISLCNSIAKPSRVSCRKNLKSEMCNLTQSLDEMLDIWTCDTHPEWVITELRCNSTTSTCSDSVFEKCIIYYNPTDTMLILTMGLLAIAIVVFVLYATNCFFSESFSKGKISLAEKLLNIKTQKSQC